jgi:gamma-glutamyl:cysteine ligase YbdK (ATP-grasp superfamily)
LRIEHRVMPAGPTPIDTIANAALFYGLIFMLANDIEAPEARLEFSQARTNFYAAAKNGLNGSGVWLDQKNVGMHELLSDCLLPMAQTGLQQQGFDQDDIDTYLDVIRGRLQTRCNGTAWQRAWVARNGADMKGLTETYAQNQQTGNPVHQWPIT